MQRDYAYYQAAFAGQTMPFAYVDLDLLDANIQQVLQRVGDQPGGQPGAKSIRVASKSLRCVSVLRRIFAASERFQGLMCFSPAEALHLAAQDFNDLLLGYPCWDAAQVRAICAAVGAGHQITLMVDSQVQVAHLDAIARDAAVLLPICLEVDLSMTLPGLHFGAWRSPLRSVEAVLAVYEAIRAAQNLRLEGLMGYEGQIAGVPDQLPGQRLKNQAIRWLKGRSIPQLRERRAAVLAALQAAGASLRFVNGGGTGSLESTRQEAAVTELTVGSAFFAPQLFDHYQHFRHLPAAGFALEIVRQPAPGIYTCLGGGYVASGAPGPERLPQPYLPAGARLDALEGAGEVQTPIHYRGGQALHLGDPVFLRHAKAGELCERFNTLLLVQDGRVVDEVPTYRGEGQAFL